MATILSYFRGVFGVEEKVKSKVGDLLDKTDPDALIEDMERATALIIFAIAQVLVQLYQQAISVGQRFSQSISGIDVGATIAPIIAAGLDMFERSAGAASEKFQSEVAVSMRRQLANGVTLENLTIQPNLFDAWKRQMQEAAENTVQYVSNITMQQTLTQAPERAGTGGDDLWTWITVHDNRVCPDCQVRHRQTRPLREWIELGLPKSGFSVCGDRDRCIVLPADYADESVDLSAPVKLTPADLDKFGTRVEDLI